VDENIFVALPLHLHFGKCNQPQHIDYINFLKLLYGFKPLFFKRFLLLLFGPLIFRRLIFDNEEVFFKDRYDQYCVFIPPTDSRFKGPDDDPGL